MHINGNTIKAEINLQQSGGTDQCSLSCCLFIITVILCALRHEIV